MDPERKAAFTPVDDDSVADGVLDEAAATAVAEQTTEEVVETKETNGDGLPVDNKARSDLGRKFSALHRRQDDFDAKIDKLLDVLTTKKEPVDDYQTLDEPMTKADARDYFKQLHNEESMAKTKQKQKYQNSYDDTLVTMSADYPNDEANAIFNELTTMRYDPTGDASRDAELNFLKAERAYLRKSTAKPKKDVPLKGDSPTGVVTSQKTPPRDEPNVKLSSAGKSYLDFVTKKDGTEKAQSLRKSLNA